MAVDALDLAPAGSRPGAGWHRVLVPDGLVPLRLVGHHQFAVLTAHRIVRLRHVRTVRGDEVPRSLTDAAGGASSCTPIFR